MRVSQRLAKKRAAEAEAKTETTASSAASKSVVPKPKNKKAKKSKDDSVPESTTSTKKRATAAKTKTITSAATSSNSKSGAAKNKKEEKSKGDSLPESTASTTESSSPSTSVGVFSASKEWKESDCGTLLYFYPPSTPYSTKIAGFDIDDTIIKTKSGKTFATNDLTDWQLWSSPNVKNTVNDLVSDGYRIVFFTNQEGISKGKVDKKKWKQKVINIIDELGLANQVTVLASLSKKENDYRKPHIGMWRFLSQHLSSPDAIPDAAHSMYVGDAAGRPKRNGKKKDFSCTDYKFALNIGGGIEFKTPEELFLKSTELSDKASLTTSTMGFQPKVNWSKYLNEPYDAVDSSFNDFVSSCGESKEVIVIVGSPASGKSSLTKRLIEDIAKANPEGPEYVRVNQDTLKTVPKCVKVAKQALEEGKSPIIDNTNRDSKTRKSYIDVAKSLKVPCRCIYIDIEKDESFHLNAYRGAMGNIYGERRTVPDMVIHTFYKNMVKPTKSEGFAEVTKLNFFPGPFDSEEQQSSFYRFTM